MIEVWKDIPGYEGLYQVSNLGRVKSYGSFVNGRNQKQIWRPGRVLKNLMGSNGYYQVTLCKDGIHKSQRVNRLVALAFLENPDNKKQVNHIDGNKRNNCVENLEWNTEKENTNHAIQTGLCNQMNKKGSMPVMQYDKKMNLINSFPSMKEAERQTGIKAGNISKSISNGYHAGGYIWKCAEEAKEEATE